MKKLVVLLIVAAMALGMVACGSQPAQTQTAQPQAQTAEPAAAEEPVAEETYELIFAHNADENNSWHQGALKFKEVLEASTNGRITVTIYPNNTLGTESECLEMMQTGACDITISADSLSTWAPEIGFMGTPYMIESEEHLEKVMDSEVGEYIENEILEKAGMRCIAWFARGPRYLTSTVKVTSAADLDGVVIRVPDVPMYVTTWQTFGAKPVPMALSEVFTSVQQGTINAQENPLALISSYGFAEVFPYVMETEHVRSWIYMVMSEAKFQSLPADLQEAVLEAAAEAQAWERECFHNDEQTLRTNLEAAGMEFVPVDKASFEELVPAILSLLTDNQRELYEKAVALK